MSDIPALESEYKYGFVTPIENEAFDKGLSEDVIRRASALPYTCHVTIPRLDWGMISSTHCD